MNIEIMESMAVTMPATQILVKINLAPAIKCAEQFLVKCDGHRSSDWYGLSSVETV